VTHPTPTDRSSTWLTLLRHLTDADPAWGAGGDVEEGFAGVGDIDIVAPDHTWARLEESFVAWARDSGLGEVVSCPHRAGTLVLVALGPPGELFFELEATATKYLRGRALHRAEDLTGLMIMDPRGFRSLRPGARSLLKFMPNGIKWGGRPRWGEAKAERVLEGVRSDSEGARAAARLFAPVHEALLRGAQAAADGRWDRRAMLEVEAWALGRSAAHPRDVLRRLAGRLRGRRSCAVLRAIGAGRRVPGDPEAWLAAVGRDHTVHGRAPRGP
jgi:hypothetical protein